MFAGRFSSSTGLIGIDYGSCGVKMLQARDKGGRLQIVGAARIDCAAAPQPAEPSGAPSDESESHVAAVADVTGLAQQIRAAFASGGFSGTRCVISLARDDVHLQSVRLPKMPDDELRQTALWEASQRFGLDRNAMEVDFLRTGAILQSGESREEVILIAASHAAINARVEPVLAAGLRPVAVDTGFSALVRTFSRQARRESDRAKVRAVVDVGDSGATVLIVRGDQVAFCKPIAIGGRQFNLAVAEHLQMQPHQAAELRASRIARECERRNPSAEHARAGAAPDRERGSTPHEADAATDRAVYEAVRPLMGDLVKEVMLCLRYYGVTFRGHPPDHIIVTGGDGLEPKLDDVLANACKAPVTFDDPAGTLMSCLPGIRGCMNRTPGPSAIWSVALGLSLRGISKRGQKSDDTAKPAAPPIAVRGSAAEARPMSARPAKEAA